MWSTYLGQLLFNVRGAGGDVGCVCRGQGWECVRWVQEAGRAGVWGVAGVREGRGLCVCEGVQKSVGSGGGAGVRAGGWESVRRMQKSGQRTG